MLRRTFHYCGNDTAEIRVRSQARARRERIQLGVAERGVELSKARRATLPIRCGVAHCAFECGRILVDTVRVAGANGGEAFLATGNAVRRLFRTIEPCDDAATTLANRAAGGAAARAATRRATAALSGRAAARRTASAAVAFLSGGTAVRGRVPSVIAAGQTQTKRGKKDRNDKISHGTHELDPAIGDS